jgi:hypothetical protein
MGILFGKQERIDSNTMNRIAKENLISIIEKQIVIMGKQGKYYYYHSFYTEKEPIINEISQEFINRGFKVRRTGYQLEFKWDE